MKIEAEILSVIYGELRQVSIGGQIIDIVPPEPEIKRTYHKRRKKPNNGDGYDKNYKTWIGKGEIKLVMNAINQFGATSNMAHIIERTGYTKSRCTAIVHYLKNKGRIEVVRNGTKVTYKEFINEEN